MNSFQKVMPGDTFRFPATVYNRIIDDINSLPDGGGSAPGTSRRPQTVMVRNISGSGLNQFDAFALDDPFILPTDDLQEWKEKPNFNCALATSGCRLAITAGGLDQGDIGEAYVAGICPAQIKIAHEEDRWADVVDNQTYLTSSKTGPVEILWRDSGDVGSTVWGLVRFGHRPARYDDPLDVQPASGNWETETEQTDEIIFSEVKDNQGVSMRVFTRVAYNHKGDEILYGFYRELLFDEEGKLVEISPETRVVIDEPELCE